MKLLSTLCADVQIFRKLESESSIKQRSLMEDPKECLTEDNEDLHN